MESKYRTPFPYGHTGFLPENIFHVLNGDCLARTFVDSTLKGNIIVVREGLLDGDVSGDNLMAFWQARVSYLDTTYDRYHSRIVTEFEKILQAPDPCEFNLWFGYDLFCQVNVWFVLSLVSDLPISKKVYMVYPTFLAPERIWEEFGAADIDDLNHCWDNRVRFGDDDLELGKQLWLAYKNNDRSALERLSLTKSPCFPRLAEVCQAHLDRFPGEGKKSRPERAIEEILQSGVSGFNAVFRAFSDREGIYGFGDVQFKYWYDKVAGI